MSLPPHHYYYRLSMCTEDKDDRTHAQKRTTGTANSYQQDEPTTPRTESHIYPGIASHGIGFRQGLIDIYDPPIENYLTIDPAFLDPQRSFDLSAPSATKRRQSITGGQFHSISSTRKKQSLATIKKGPGASPKIALSTSNSGPRTRHAHNHQCKICGYLYDRAERARDCAYRDIGWTPYICGGRCGRPDCPKAYSFEVHLRGHIAPPEKRKVQCSRCLKPISRKNIARHRREICHNTSDGE